MVSWGAAAESKPYICIVDADSATRRPLVRSLTSFGYGVRGVASIAAAMRMTLADAVCCVLIDVSLHDQSGFDLQRHLATGDAAAETVFMTANGDVAMAVRAMKGGAVDFLVKPLRMSELLPALDAALARSLRRREARQHDTQMAVRAARLTPRERQVLELVLEGLRNKQIAAALSSQESTVKVHRSRLMRKLEANTLAELLRIGASLARSAEERIDVRPGGAAARADAMPLRAPSGAALRRRPAAAPKRRDRRE